MKAKCTLLTVVAALSFALIPVATPAGTVSADTDELITALVLDEAEATALGLEFVSIDDTSSGAGYVTAKYIDHSSSPYSIDYTITLSLLESSSDAEEITVESMSYGCDACVDPDCSKFRCDETGELYDFARPCYSPFRNGYTDFGGLSGETAFAQGDLLVKIESSTLYGITTPEYYEQSKSHHEWFVEQVVTKITADYLADMMQLTAHAFIATQPTGADVYMSGQYVVVLEGTVMGPNGGVDGAVLEGFYYSETGSGWNYALTTDSSGNFRGVMGSPDEVARIGVRVRHTDTSPAYAGTFKITVDVGGQSGVVDTGMSVGVSTDKTVYSAGEMVVISCSVADSKGGLAGASLVFDVNGSPVAATVDPSGKYTFAHGLAADIADGVYTITVTASHADYPDAKNSTTFIVGNMGVLVEQNPVTEKPFVGVAADGVSTLTMGVSLPGCKDVSVTMPDIGELKGESLSAAGTIKLDSAGQAEFTYYPPDYLTKEQLGKNVDVHQTGSMTWFAEVPMTFTYKDADGKEGRLDGAILVCRPPVMLVHGFVGGTATWGMMSTYLRGEKFDTFLGNYLLQDLSIEELSGVLQSDIFQQKLDYAKSNLKLTKVDAVGHSMGGLISRYYANGLPGYAGDLRKLIMVGTPKHGVRWLKKKAGKTAANWYDTHKIPREQLYSESAFMKALNSGEKTGAHLNL
ncbi:MAG: alpha/beta fold hydrolase, partial [Dehalococcoidia bacterium]